MQKRAHNPEPERQFEDNPLEAIRRHAQELREKARKTRARSQQLLEASQRTIQQARKHLAQWREDHRQDQAQGTDKPAAPPS